MKAVFGKKATFLFIITILLAFLLSGCVGDNGFVLETLGKEAFDQYSGEFQLEVFLLPEKDFPSRFPAISEYYHFFAKYKHNFSIFAPESLIVLYQYNPLDYEEAKAYCLQHMELQDIGVPDCNGYSFLEDIRMAESDAELAKIHRGEATGSVQKDESLKSFPYLFNMFAFNDQECKLAFLGCHSMYYSYSDKDKVIGDWENFVKEFFPELMGQGRFTPGKTSAEGYCMEDFDSIVIGKSTAQDVIEIAQPDLLDTGSDRGYCEYPRKGGGRIRFEFKGLKLVVTAIEEITPDG